MKRTRIPMAFLIFVTALSSESYSQEEFPVLKGPYLGQQPPGLVAEVFAPGIVSVDGRYEGVISFSPGLEEVYFGANNQSDETAIYFSRLEDGNWSSIKKADFTKGEKDEEIHPSVSPDGKRVYFTALNSDLTDTRIWYVNRLENAWSNAIRLDSPVNAEQVFYPNQAKNGDLYYFDLSKGKTYYAAGNEAVPEIKPVDIAFGIHGFMSPSQTYLVMNARNKDGEGRKDNDIYVCFKDRDGKWSEPIKLGSAVNSTANEKTPSISPDGKYLFFGRDEEDGYANIYWVSTDVIEKLRPAS